MFLILAWRLFLSLYSFLTLIVAPPQAPINRDNRSKNNCIQEDHIK